MPPLSRSRIDRAGERLLEWWQGDDDLGAELLEDVDIVVAFRASFGYPLTKVSVGLRQFVERESSDVIVSQRLKRMPTILGKLARLPSMKLSRMEDIGGCRAVLTGGAPEVAGVLHRIQRRWTVKRLRDYVTDPKATGYRAVHVVVERDERLIEIQLRTPRQHEWAVAVDRAVSRLGMPELKDGNGPQDLTRYFERAAYAIALEESGALVDDQFQREFAALREQVRPYFA